MNQEFEDELSMEERRALAGLARETPPPAALEERVVATLKQAKLLRSAQSVWGGRVPRIGWALAASLLCFALGAAAGARWVSRTAQKPNSPEFMLVLRAAPEQAQPHTTDEVLRRVKEYGDWAGRLRQQGVQIDGEKLKREARILRGTDGRVVVADERADANREAIAGYFLIATQDYEYAVKVAEGCPHLKYGGSIEVRQLERFLIV